MCKHVEAAYAQHNKINSPLLDTCVECLKELEIMLDTSLPHFKSHLYNDKVPLVSINVVDEDNAICCACESKENESSLTCDKCGLIFRKLSSTINLDSSANKINNQFLSSTYSSSYSEIRKFKDPYTPESIDSYSPNPGELAEEKEFSEFINVTNDDDDELISQVIKPKDICTEGSHVEADVIHHPQSHLKLDHSVSPSQLQTRLEILRRESQNDCSSKGSGSGLCEANEKKLYLNNKCCLGCSYCTLL